MTFSISPFFLEHNKRCGLGVVFLCFGGVFCLVVCLGVLGVGWVGFFFFFFWGWWGLVFYFVWFVVFFFFFLFWCSQASWILVARFWKSKARDVDPPP